MEARTHTGPPPAPAAPLRVFILDDHEVVRRGVRDLLEAEPDIVVAGEAATAREALARVPASAPDVAVPLTGILPLGDTYRVHDVRDYYGPPLASSTFLGDPVRLPLPSRGLRAARGAVVPLPTIAPRLAVFIVEGSLIP